MKLRKLFKALFLGFALLAASSAPALAATVTCGLYDNVDGTPEPTLDLVTNTWWGADGTRDPLQAGVGLSDNTGTNLDEAHIYAVMMQKCTNLTGSCNPSGTKWCLPDVNCDVVEPSYDKPLGLSDTAGQTFTLTLQSGSSFQDAGAGSPSVRYRVKIYFDTDLDGDSDASLSNNNCKD